MKTTKDTAETIIEIQANTLNNWMDSTKKLQSALASGNITSEGQSIYKDWLSQQMNIFGGAQANANNFFEASNTNKPEEFFKNWYNQQLSSIKQITDFNQSIYTSYANFGKSPSDYVNNFTSSNNAWTNIYNSWMQTLNASYDTFVKNFNNPLSKDVFKNMFESNQMYLKVQDVFQPMLKAIQGNDFSVDTWKNIYSTENYKKITEQMFGSYFQGGNMKDVYENATKQVQNFFTNQNNLSKEYFAQIQNMSTEFPQLFGGNFEKLKDLYSTSSVFGKTFEPILKLVNASKEKSNIETVIALMDKIAAYSIKQTELQNHLYSTTQKSFETFAKQTSEKYKNIQNGKTPDMNELYNEWVKTNETYYAELFASEEFSKIKADVLGLTMDIKKQFEKQFESSFEHYPVVFRSEIEELHKTIYDLKKTIKELQTKLAIQPTTSTTEFFEEEKSTKNRKK